MTSLNEYNEMVRTGKSAMTALIAPIRSELSVPNHYLNPWGLPIRSFLRAIKDRTDNTEQKS